MGANSGVRVDVDLDANRATLEVDGLFEDGELSLEEVEEGWRGFVRDGDRYFWVDTSRRAGDWTRKQPVTERTVRAMVERLLVGEGVTA